MKAISTNGFSFTASINANGEQMSLVAHKDDHEGRKTVVFTFAASDASQVLALVELLRGNLHTAKQRRKAIRRAEREASQATTGPSPEQL